MFITTIDHSLAEKILSTRSLSIAHVMSYITWLGNAEIIILLTVICLYLFWKNKQKNYTFGLLATIASSGILNWLLKHLIHRARPLGGLEAETSYSFPSGHATLSMALYGFCVYYIWKTIADKNKKIFFLIFNTLLILLIGFTRLYLGVHYLSDVISGYLLGSTCLLFGIYITKRK